MSSFRIVKKEDVSLDTTYPVYETLYVLDEETIKMDEKVYNTSAKRSVRAKQIKQEAKDLIDAQMKVITDFETGGIQLTDTEKVVKNALTGKCDASWEKKCQTSEEKEYKISGENSSKFIVAFKAWRIQVEEIYKYIYEEIERNCDALKDVDVSSSDAASAFSKLLADDSFNKIRALERDIEFRKFYFAGGVPKLKKRKAGTVSVGNNWDPRYLQEYIDQAEMNNFHWWFVKLTDESGGRIEPYSFPKAWNDIQSGMNVTGNKKPNGHVSLIKLRTIFVGMDMFNKFDAFAEYVEEASGVNLGSGMMDDMYENLGESECQKLISKMTIWVGTKSKLQKQDTGYYNMDDAMAFDSVELLKQWTKYNRQYEEFKKKLWKILEENPVLQLCTNNAQITGENIKIEQTMDCYQQIQNSSEEGAGSGGSTTPTTPVAPTAPTTPTTPTTGLEKTEEEKNKDGKDDKGDGKDGEPAEEGLSTGVIIGIIVAIGVVIAGIIVFFVIKKKRSMNRDDETVEQNPTTGGVLMFV